MKSFKKIAVTILAAVMVLLISTTVFAADSPAKKTFSNASLAKKTVVYNGKKQQPKVVLKDKNGKVINSKYYKVTVKTCKNAGKYTVTIDGLGKYAGYQNTLTYTITKAKQHVSVKSPWTYSVKASSVKKKPTTFSKAIKITKKAGTVSYRTSNPNITVNKNGKIVVAKGTAKGKYFVKLAIRSNNYKTVTKTLWVYVK